MAKLLFIDDQKYYLDSLIASARRWGHECHGIIANSLPEDRKEGLGKIVELVRSMKPDLVFLDESMSPGGREVAEVIGVPREKLIGTSTASEQSYCSARFPHKESRYKRDRDLEMLDLLERLGFGLFNSEVTIVALNQRLLDEQLQREDEERKLLDARYSRRK